MKRLFFKNTFVIIYYLCVFMRVCTSACMCGGVYDVDMYRGQRTSSLFLLCGSWGMNLGSQAWWPMLWSARSALSSPHFLLSQKTDHKFQFTFILKIYFKFPSSKFRSQRSLAPVVVMSSNGLVPHGVKR